MFSTYAYQFVPCKSRSTVKRRYPEAIVIARVEGGFRAFFSRSDYLKWRNQR